MVAAILTSRMEGELLIVHPDFVVAKPAKQFCLACGAFLVRI